MQIQTKRMKVSCMAEMFFISDSAAYLKSTEGNEPIGPGATGLKKPDLTPMPS